MNQQQYIFVTGGMGYIGSHCCVNLIEAGYKVVVLDNFSNSSKKVATNIEKIAGSPVEVVEGDLRDRELLKKLFSAYKFEAVIHFAGLKSVNESIEQPIKYYDNNVAGSICLFEAMTEANIKKLVFSSSAVVYSGQNEMPVKETANTSTGTPYGSSKLFVEYILKDIAKSDPEWKIGMLRYFNPVGAHQSGLIGEKPNGIPNNLMPYITQTAKGIRKVLSVFGDDYETRDGSGVRDFIHVLDLSESHVAVLKHLDTNAGIHIYNIGTGKGTSVLELVNTFKQQNNVDVPFVIAPRRPGDLPEVYADCSKIHTEVKWRAKYSIEDMVRDSWKWENTGAQELS